MSRDAIHVRPGDKGLIGPLLDDLARPRSRCG
jgi:hypothetical protein